MKLHFLEDYHTKIAGVSAQIKEHESSLFILLILIIIFIIGELYESRK